MKFSDYSIYQFCEKVYSLFEVPSDRTQIPLVDMYQFIEEKSNNFDLKSFEYLIQDIRNFHINIEFNTINPAACPEIEIDQATGLQSTENKELRESHKYYLKHNFNDIISIFEYGISSLICIFDFKCKLKFTDKQTLRQKVELFHKALPSALFLHDLDSLLKFSDLAEKEYARIIESSKTTPNNIIQLKLEENHTTNSVLQEKPIIKQPKQAQINDEINYNATPAEFCSMLYKLHGRRSYDDDVTPSQMEKYIKSVTKNYNKPDFEYLLSEIRNFAHKIQILIPRPENEIIKKNDDNENDSFEENKYKYYDTDPITLSIIFNIESEVDEQETLREKIRTLKNHIPEAKFRAGLTDLLYFSEIAEKQYRLRTESENFNSDNYVVEQSQTIRVPHTKNDIFTNKKYLELTTHQFCDALYPPKTGLEETDYYNNTREEKVTEHIMYQFIKHNTDDFDKTSFKHLIADIRDYAYSMTFHLPKIYQDGTESKPYDCETGYYGFPIPTCEYYFNFINNWDEFSIETITDWDGSTPQMYRLKHNIPENYTLFERYKLILEKIPLAEFRCNIDDLLHFSEFAEDEYAKITETTENNESESYTPTIQTIWKTTDELKTAHAKLNKLLKCDLNTWLYWFGGIPLNNPKQIKWVFKGGIKRALSYFIEKISMDHSIDYSKARKIFNIDIYSKDKYQLTFKEIDDLLK
ncbi:MAG: hypothetical protein JZU53_01375 [Paludibacter sp.]|nr:hypothetical protein [Paludibacter sp.]